MVVNCTISTKLKKYKVKTKEIARSFRGGVMSRDTRQKLTALFFITGFVILTSFVSSCASQGPSQDESAATVAEKSSSEQNTTQSQDSTVQQDPAGTSTAQSQSQQQNLDQVPQIAGPPKMVEECKKEPYVKYEQQARNSISMGWEATKAQRFGVGFRNADEYKKWSNTHNDVFTKVTELCEALSICTKQNKADKNTKCVEQAKQFAQWQKLSERFATKVKSVETTQPPMLCSLKPKDTDPSECFNLLADQIGQTCQTETCKDASICFRGVYFLDDAINQAELACGFVGQKLSNCRGYIEATGRRKAEFEQCLGLYEQLEVEILPVL